MMGRYSSTLECAGGLALIGCENVSINRDKFVSI
jgi:hypothetical protein